MERVVTQQLRTTTLRCVTFINPLIYSKKKNIQALQILQLCLQNMKILYTLNPLHEDSVL